MSEQQIGTGLPSRSLLLKIGITCVAVAAFGLLITGDFGKYWVGTWYFPGIGYALFDVGVGALLVFGFVERLLSRERKRDNERETARWNNVRDRVIKLIATELAGIATEMINATNPLQGGFAAPDATNEQIEHRARNTILRELERMSEDPELLRSRVEQRSPNILDRPSDIFALRAERLGNLQQRDWSRFLDSKRAAYLIDLEHALETLDIHTRITARERQHPGREGSLEEALRGMYDPEVYRDLQTILKLILQGVHENWIEIL